jgi:hypothetical protein
MLAKKKRRDLDQLLEDDILIESALREGVRDALRRHKEAGLPVAAWRNGKVVWVPPQKIVLGAKARVGGKRKTRRRMSA